MYYISIRPGNNPMIIKNRKCSIGKINALDVYFISIGLISQRKVKKTHSVIKALALRNEIYFITLRRLKSVSLGYQPDAFTNVDAAQMHTYIFIYLLFDVPYFRFIRFACYLFLCLCLPKAFVMCKLCIGFCL